MEDEVIEALIKRRKKLGLTQEQLGNKIGRGQDSIGRIEAKLNSPTLRYLVEVLEALNLEIIIREKGIS